MNSLLFLGLFWTLTSADQVLTISTTAAESKPVAGSERLRTISDIVPGTGTEFIANSIKVLEKIVSGMDQLTGAPRKEREVELRKVVSNLLDHTRLGQRALISHWDALGKTPKGRIQRDKYMKLFRELVEENYMEQARKYIGGNYILTLTGEQKGAGTETVVNGRIKKSEADVFVEFNLLNEKNQWKVADIKLDATSLEATYRSSFNRIIRKKGGLEAGFPDLIKTMEKRLAELKSGSAARL